MENVFKASDIESNKRDEARRRVFAGQFMDEVEQKSASSHKRTIWALAKVFAELKLLNENIRGREVK